MEVADSKIFKVNKDIDAEKIGKEVERFLRSEKNLYAEGFSSHDGYLVQAREVSTWKKLSGLGQALQIQIIPHGEAEVLVNIGQAKWIDKAGAAAVGLFVFAPLFITSAVGAYLQNRLPDDIFVCIEKFIMLGGVSVSRETQFEHNDPLASICPSCGQKNTKGTKFCSGCGLKLTKTCPVCCMEIDMDIKFCPSCGFDFRQAKSNRCPQCNVEISADKKFCPECGASMADANKIKCPSCGAMVDKYEKYCPDCGKWLDEANICPKCGAEIIGGKKFCGKCGTRVEN